MKHESVVKIYHKDTDCYGIVWHGAYLRWFEIGRVEIAHMLGFDSIRMEQELEILMPVVELNCRYKSPARLMDEICIITEIKDLTKTSITFSHTIRNTETGNLIILATSTIVTTDKNGKLFRKIPDFIYEKFSEAFENSEKIDTLRI